MAASVARGFLPTNAADFLRRRLSELCGLVLASVSLLVAAALFSFDPRDPSLNHAADGPVQNLLGPSGAMASDALFQTLGWAPYLLPLVLLVWGFRLMLNRSVAAVPLRLGAVLLAIVVAAPALAVLPPPDWALR